MNWLGHHDHCRSFSDDALHLHAVCQHYAGVHPIPVSAIVGSVGRQHELASDFLPRTWVLGSPRGDDRYRSIRAAMVHAVPLPAIEVYQLGSQYYVLDGHHRVAAARSVGQVEIDAVVTAFDAVPDTYGRADA